MTHLEIDSKHESILMSSIISTDVVLLYSICGYVFVSSYCVHPFLSSLCLPTLHTDKLESCTAGDTPNLYQVLLPGIPECHIGGCVGHSSCCWLLSYIGRHTSGSHAAVAWELSHSQCQLLTDMSPKRQAIGQIRHCPEHRSAGRHAVA